MSVARLDLLDIADEPEPAAAFTRCVERLTPLERIAFVETMDGLAEGLRTRLHGGAGKRASRAFDAMRRTDPVVMAWLDAGGKAALRRWAVAGGLVATTADALDRKDHKRVALLALVFRAMPLHEGG
ncbi:MAG TPA: hypothetical protein VES19_16915 [Candidatus Limnocylindrales bacterium]|nr:hypothetical protein [Candidatus Limnocylindrales bacterium]